MTGHFRAVVTALLTELARRGPSPAPGEWTGGSTYGFQVWEEHPHFCEAVALLQSTRDLAVALRGKIEAYNAENRAPPGVALRVEFYVGQSVLDAPPPNVGDVENATGLGAA